MPLQSAPPFSGSQSSLASSTQTPAPGHSKAAIPPHMGALPPCDGVQTASPSTTSQTAPGMQSTRLQGFSSKHIASPSTSVHVVPTGHKTTAQDAGEVVIPPSLPGEPWPPWAEHAAPRNRAVRTVRTRLFFISTPPDFETTRCCLAHSRAPSFNRHSLHRSCQRREAEVPRDVRKHARIRCIPRVVLMQAATHLPLHRRFATRMAVPARALRRSFTGPAQALHRARPGRESSYPGATSSSSDVSAASAAVARRNRAEDRRRRRVRTPGPRA